jgi:ABC-type transport system involved in cytochrome bd biosynthesis fused ATPase/permease subunit
MRSSWNNRWPLERVLFALAGTVTLTSALLAATVSPWFLLLTAFVGVNQWLYVTVGACPASLVVHRLFGITGCRFSHPDRLTLGS